MDAVLYENLSIWRPEPWQTDGKYGIPRISPSSLPHVDAWKPFNYVLSGGVNGNQGVSMYLHDYQINRLWNQPTRYVEMLSKAGCVLTPDYSMYADVPMALNLYSHYRKQWVGAYWQQHGVRAIPTICWADGASFDWCFDGEPTNGVVSVSSIGTQRYADTKSAFMRGYDAMLERLQPDTILFFGKVPAECRGNICPVEAFYESVKRRRTYGR